MSSVTDPRELAPAVPMAQDEHTAFVRQWREGRSHWHPDSDMRRKLDAYDAERRGCEGAEKLVAINEAVIQLYTEIIQRIEAVDSTDGSPNWWLFAEQARKHVLERYAETHRKVTVAEKRVATLEAALETIASTTLERDTELRARAALAAPAAPRETFDPADIGFTLDAPREEIHRGSGTASGQPSPNPSDSMRDGQGRIIGPAVNAAPREEGS